MNPHSPTESRPTGPGCLSETDLGGLLAGDVAADEATSRHLEACADCRSRLEAMAGTGELRVRGVRAGEPTETPLAEAMEALRHAAPSAEPVADASPASQVILDPPDAPGMLGRFAEYDVLEMVASGGMGVVYKGFDRALQRVVAIKVLAPALAAGPTARARFVREARAAAAVNHENVVAIHAVGECGGLPFLVMQFVAGRSLQARLDADGPMTTEGVLRVGLQAAAGLAAAHAQGLIHRDVKPGNILLENSVERVKLTDFGLARAADATDVTRPGMVAGTPEYMAPEQARGERLDARADLFALGTVLYAAATGVSPFRSDSTPATLRRVCEHRPPPLDEVDSRHPRWLGDIVERLMAKAPVDRYPDATTVARLLEQGLARLRTGRGPASEFAAPTPRRASIAWRRTWVVVGMLAIAGLVAPWWPFGASTTGAPYRRVSSQGMVRGFTNLVDAVRGVGSDEVVELDWDGPRVHTPLALTGQVVRLRAAEGRWPVVVNASRTEPWLTTDAALRVEGIELRSAGVGFRGEAPGRSIGVGRMVADLARRPIDRLRPHHPEQQLLVSRGADIELVNCRLIGASQGEDIAVPLLVLGSPEVRLINCEVYHAGGPAISWQAAEGNRVRLSNTVLMARSAFFVSSASGVVADFELDRCTFVGAFLIATPTGSDSLRGRGRGNVFSLRRPAIGPPGAAPGGRNRWHGSGNVYDRIGTDAGFAIPATEEGSMSMDLALDARVRARVAGMQPLVPHDFALVVDAASRSGGPVGIDPDGVGPGEAWRRRKAGDASLNQR